MLDRQMQVDAAREPTQHCVAHSALGDIQMSYPSDALNFNELRRANVARFDQFKNAKGEFLTPSSWTPLTQSLFFSTALAGEVGEACNLVKKHARADMPIDQARDLIAKELADVQIYLDLLAHVWGIDLGEATRNKFNEVSKRVDSNVRL